MSSSRPLWQVGRSHHVSLYRILLCQSFQDGCSFLDPLPRPGLHRTRKSNAPQSRTKELKAGIAKLRVQDLRMEVSRVHGCMFLASGLAFMLVAADFQSSRSQEYCVKSTLEKTHLLHQSCRCSGKLPSTTYVAAVTFRRGEGHVSKHNEGTAGSSMALQILLFAIPHYLCPVSHRQRHNVLKRKVPCALVSFPGESTRLCRKTVDGSQDLWEAPAKPGVNISIMTMAALD